jgi:hypothetical protein
MWEFLITDLILNKVIYTLGMPKRMAISPAIKIN